MSAPYLGDFAEDATLHFIWSSYNSSGASVTRSTNGTISVYKNNGVTQSTAGITDTEDFDSLTGIHACTIDLSADAFYAAGANYTVVLSGATIDSQSVNAVLAHFSIENRTAFPKADYPTNFSDLSITASSGRIDVGSWVGNAVTASGGNNKPDVNVDEWADTPLATTNPLPNAAADAAGGLPISDAGGLDLDAIKTATDLLNTAQAEPTGVPAANETPLTKIGYLFMALRNKVTVTSTKKTYFDDGDAAEFEKDLSDDGTTYTESETNAI